MEEPLEKEPGFKAYKEVANIADPVCLKYFKKWYEIIQLEQSAANVTAHSALNTTEKRQVKDEGLMISRIEPSKDSRKEFFVYVER